MKPTWFKKKGNKFGAKKTSVDGIVFHSKREAEYYGQLKILKAAKVITDFQMQVSFQLYAAGAKSGEIGPAVAKHIVDFVVCLPNHVREVHEVKGMETDVWKLKKKIFEANYPDLTYRVIK